MKERHRNRINAATLARLDELPVMLKAERTRRGLSQREAADQIGVISSTVQRVERGGIPDAPGFLAIVAWLDVSVGWFTAESEQRDAYRRGWDDCEATVQAALAAGREAGR